MNKRQLAAWKQFKDIFYGSSMVRFGRGVVALLIVAVQLLLSICFDTPNQPTGQPLSLNERFKLVWQDEFDGDDLDWNTWGGHYVWGKDG